MQTLASAAASARPMALPSPAGARSTSAGNPLVPMLMELCANAPAAATAELDVARKEALRAFRERVYWVFCGYIHDKRDERISHSTLDDLLQPRRPELAPQFAQPDLAQLRLMINVAWQQVAECASWVCGEEEEKTTDDDADEPGAPDFLACHCTLPQCETHFTATRRDLQHCFRVFLGHALHFAVVYEAGAQLCDFIGDYRRTVLHALWGWLGIGRDPLVVRWERHPGFSDIAVPLATERARQALCTQIAVVAREIVQSTALYVYLDRTTNIAAELGKPATLHRVATARKMQSDGFVAPVMAQVKSVSVGAVKLASGETLLYRNGCFQSDDTECHPLTLSWRDNAERARRMEAERQLELDQKIDAFVRKHMAEGSAPRAAKRSKSADREDGECSSSGESSAEQE